MSSPTEKKLFVGLEGVLDLFCIWNPDKTDVYGMDTKLFETVDDAVKTLELKLKELGWIQIKDVADAMANAGILQAVIDIVLSPKGDKK